MDEVIEVGVEDFENDVEGNIVVWIQLFDMVYVVKMLGMRFDFKVLSVGIVWMLNEGIKVRLDSGIQYEKFVEMFEQMREDGDVQVIYSNVMRGEMSDEEWGKIEECLS